MLNRIRVRVLLLLMASLFLGYILGSNLKKCECAIHEDFVTVEDEQQPRQPIDNGQVTIESHSQKIDKFGGAKVVGEVMNNTNKPVSWVKVLATFYDENGDVLGSDYAYAGETTDNPLLVGVKAPFELSTYPDDYVPDDYQLQVFWK